MAQARLWPGGCSLGAWPSGPNIITDGLTDGISARSAGASEQVRRSDGIPRWGKFANAGRNGQRPTVRRPAVRCEAGLSNVVLIGRGRRRFAVRFFDRRLVQAAAFEERLEIGIATSEVVEEFHRVLAAAA